MERRRKREASRSFSSLLTFPHFDFRALPAAPLGPGRSYTALQLAAVIPSPPSNSAMSHRPRGDVEMADSPDGPAPRRSKRQAGSAPSSASPTNKARIGSLPDPTVRAPSSSSPAPPVLKGNQHPLHGALNDPIAHIKNNPVASSQRPLKKFADILPSEYFSITASAPCCRLTAVLCREPRLQPRSADPPRDSQGLRRSDTRKSRPRPFQLNQHYSTAGLDRSRS